MKSSESTPKAKYIWDNWAADSALIPSLWVWRVKVFNIFVKQLQDLKPTERPIHCSDTDNLKFYYKDENKWEQDKQNEKMDDSTSQKM